MSLGHCMYVSRSLISEGNEPTIIADIVAASRLKNANLGLTGALLFADGQFAQFLEGPSVAITEVMIKVRNDRRHTDIVTLTEGHVVARQLRTGR